MTGITNMNIVLGQGDAVKEVQGARRQNLGMDQQSVPQDMAARARRRKQRIEAPQTGDEVRFRSDAEKEERGDDGADNPGSGEKKKTEDGDSPGKNRIDIVV